MKRQKSLKTLKEALDRAFSTFIRQRGMDGSGNNVCVACGAVLPWQKLQAAHYHRRQHMGTRFDPRNVWPCCFACNVWRRGNYANYAKFMYAKFSQAELDELDALHKKTVKLTRSDLEAMIKRYSEAI